MDKCDRCGRFTKEKNLVGIDYSGCSYSGDDSDAVMECRNCMCGADEERYFKDGKKGNQ